MAVDMTIEELTGDQDTDSTYLTVAKESVPGAPADGDTVNAKVVNIVPGLSFLVIGAADGDVPLTVEELQGDADTDSVYLVAPKSIVTGDPGTVLSATEYDLPDGSKILLAQV